ncbi:MAG: hypothetical protein WDW38_001154 [Sanguina aurantia]
MAIEQKDLYGFSTKVNPQQIMERLDCDDNVIKSQALWAPYVESNKFPTDSKLKELVRKGIPPTLRAWVWMETSGANAKKAAHAASYYSIMLTASETSPFIKDVQTDSAHTFPGHAWLASEDGQSALQRVLLAYSAHNDRVGYCRSMNNIVAMLLVMLNRNEESAFWLLAALVEDILHPGTYARNLEGCQVEMRALDELITTKIPKLHAHFQAVELDISIIATDWYLCLFCTSLPSETVARVWDALFHEGPKIIYRVSLAVLRIYEENILRVDNAGEIMMRLRSAASTMHQRDILMATAFDGIGGLPMATIDKYRDLKTQSRGGQGMTATETHTSGGGGDITTVKLKAGFGAFMGGLSKLADKTAQLADKTMQRTTESLAKLTTKESQKREGGEEPGDMRESGGGQGHMHASPGGGGRVTGESSSSGGEGGEEQRGGAGRAGGPAAGGGTRSATTPRTSRGMFRHLCGARIPGRLWMSVSCSVPCLGARG